MNKSKIGLGLLIAAVMLVGMAGIGWGIEPWQMISIQGKLVGLTTPIAPGSTRTLTFRIYDRPALGATLLWEESQTLTIGENGIFDTRLGRTIPINLNFDPTQNYYVGIQVTGDTNELDPRQLLVSVPFAIVARNVRGGTVVAGNSAGNGVYGEVTSDTLDSGWSAGVYGRGRAGTHGVMGYTASATRNAVMGWNDGSGSGVYGFGRAGIGVQGYIPNKKANGTTDNDNTNPAVYGYNLSPATGDNPGVKGESVKGYGVYAKSYNGIGIQSVIPDYLADGTTRTFNFNPAIKGTTNYGHGTYGPLGYGAGVYGENTAAAGGGPGVRGVSASGDGVGGETAAAGGIVSGGSGVIGKSTAASSGGAGVKGISVSGIGVMGSSGSATLPGIQGENISGGPAIKGTANGFRGGSDLELGAGVFGINTSTSNNAGSGVYGEANGKFSWGVSGRTMHSTNGSGVWGNSQYGGASGGLAVLGVYGLAAGKGVGVYGDANVSGAHAIHGFSSYRDGVSFAGYFDGDVYVSRNLSKASGSFLIDHPLDPKNKILRHSFIESPDMKNIYDGIAVMDEKGETVVNLPDYFEALNKDFRYQLTSIGVPSPGIYVKEEISGNKFKIAGGKAGQKISWMVTGIRHDAYAQKYPIVVEEEKQASGNFKKGEYIHADAFDDQLRMVGTNQIK